MPPTILVSVKRETTATPGTRETTTRRVEIGRASERMRDARRRERGASEGGRVRRWDET